MATAIRKTRLSLQSVACPREATLVQKLKADLLKR
jgi:hypothetical protein